MATGDVLSGDIVKIYIGDVNDTHAEIDATGDPSKLKQFQSEVTNANSGGGSLDYESKAVFGGFIDLKKPQEQIEITMDVLMRFGPNVDKWDVLKAGGVAKMICVDASRNTDYYWEAFNNVRVVNFDKEFEADGEWKGTMTFKLSPTDADGNSNKQIGKLGSADDLTNGIQAWA